MRILVVDDQRSARRTLRGILQSLGLDQLEVVEAANLDEAMAAVAPGQIAETLTTLTVKKGSSARPRRW